MINMQNSQDSRDTRVKKADRNHTCCGGDLASLGNTAKSDDISKNKDYKRLNLYKMQDTAVEFLHGLNNRIACCLRLPQKNKGITLARSPKGDVKYKGLQMCGSRWACVICSAKLLESSRQDILYASKKHLKAGGGFLLVTLTIPHHIKQSAQFLVDLQDDALKKFWSNGKHLWKSIGKIGQIRSHEFKHGANGWHSHFHILVYIKSPLKDKQRLYDIQTNISNLWLKSCLSVGLPAPHAIYGCDVQSCIDPEKASLYIVKDSFEISYSNTKGSKSDSINPFDLLTVEDYKYGNPKELFRDYYLATFGRAIISWSKGLKKHFGVNDKLDDDILHEELEEFKEVIKIHYSDFKQIVKNKKRYEFLMFAREFLKVYNDVDLVSLSSDWQFYQNFIREAFENLGILYIPDCYH